MKDKYINPFTDTGFKIIFGKEGQSEEILIGFLNALFADKPLFEPITKVKYTNTERTRNTDRGKTIIHDVICETSSGHKFILEMQNTKHDDFLYRSTYYTCRGVTDQVNLIGKGKKTYRFNPVVSVFMCNFTMPGLEPKLVSHFMQMDTDTHHLLKTGVRMAYVQLPKFHKSWEECENKLEQWIFILKNMYTHQTFPKISRKDEVFQRLEQVSNYASLTAEEQEDYEADLVWMHDYEEGLETAKRDAAKEGRAEGRAEGIAEGRAEGIAEGRAEGKAEGLAEGRQEEKWELAKKFFDLGIDLATISQGTGITMEELKKKFEK